MGHFVRRKSENQFRRETPRRYEWMAIEWLEWEAKNTGYHVSYQGNQNRKCLIESMYGEKIIVISPLLKWYVQHGLKVTKIHQMVEYTPAACFQKFGDNISDARRSGDIDPNKRLWQRRRSWKAIRRMGGQ